MKVLWSVNIFPPKIAKIAGLVPGHAISWVEAMAEEMKKDPDIQFAIVSRGGHRTLKLESFIYDGIKYYVLPFGCEIKDYWGLILSDFQPDIIHAYGTEHKQNLILIEKYGSNYPIIISLQGIIREYEKHYFASIPISDIIKNYTVHDIFFRNGIFEGRQGFRRQIKYETRMLQGVKYVEGRSDWDKAMSLDINPNLDYYWCPRMIRSSFYNYCWSLPAMMNHSLFVHQGNYPIKGLHHVIQALSIVRKKYSDVMLYVSGNSFMHTRHFKENGYQRYIRKLIKEMNLERHIIFTGYLNSDEMAKILSTVNACIIPSAIENAPNSLAEAMIVGTPCIASYVGGNADMLNYGQCGLLYCYDEPPMLADRIDKIFSDRNLAQKFSEMARNTAMNRHDRSSLVNRLKDIYETVILKSRNADNNFTEK